MKKIVGENLTELRKSKKMTQFELADQFNYSDKAVSKWENGDTLPDFETLNNLALFYGVTLDYLTHPVEENKIKVVTDSKLQFNNHVAITALMISIWWIIATIVFVYSLIINGSGYWISFIWALIPSALVLSYFNRKWFTYDRTITIVAWSILNWSIISGFFFHFLEYAMWPMFLVGVPIEVSIFLWAAVKRKN